jgi:hypothetical protein
MGAASGRVASLLPQQLGHSSRKAAPPERYFNRKLKVIYCVRGVAALLFRVS